MSNNNKLSQSAVQLLGQNLPENSRDLPKIKGLTTAFYCRNCFLMNYAGILTRFFFCIVFLFVLLISELEEKQKAGIRMNNGRQQMYPKLAYIQEEPRCFNLNSKWEEFLDSSPEKKKIGFKSLCEKLSLK